MLVLAFVIAAMLAVTAAWASDAGLIRPVLTDPEDDGLAWSSGWSYNTRSHHFTYEVKLHNYGDADVVVTGGGRAGPGLRLRAVKIGSEDATWTADERTPPSTTGFPKTIVSGHSATLGLFYEVTDCDAVSSALWPVPVRVKQWWGETIVDLQLEPRRAHDAPSSYTTHDGRSAYDVEWQKYMADQACSPPEDDSAD